MPSTFWRICPARHVATAFDGEGARLHGGRWNPQGVGLVYCSTSLSLATLEALVHFDPLTALPKVSIRASIPDDVGVEHLPASKLPSGWRSYPAPSSLAAIGAEWVLSGRTVALLVPSAVTPIEDNVLINPGHADMAKIVIDPAEPFDFDPRVIKK